VQQPRISYLLKGKCDAKDHPFLWYDGNAEEAANFYISIFKNSKMGKISRYGDAGPGPKGSVMSVTFQIEGQEFLPSTAARISSSRPPSPSSSIAKPNRKSTTSGKNFPPAAALIAAAGSRQVRRLLANHPGGSRPTARDKDPQRAKRAMQAMLQMTKIDINKLQQAAAEAKSSATTNV